MGEIDSETSRESILAEHGEESQKEFYVSGAVITINEDENCTELITRSVIGLPSLVIHLHKDGLTFFISIGNEFHHSHEMAYII